MEYDRFSSKFSRMYYIDLEYILISILSNIYFISDFAFQIRRTKKKTSDLFDRVYWFLIIYERMLT